MVDELVEKAPRQGRKHRVVIRWGWILFFVCVVLHSRLFDDWYMALGWAEPSQARKFFYDSGHYLLAVTLSLMMIFGLRELKESGFSFRRSVAPLFAALVMIGLSVFFYKVSYELIDWIDRTQNYGRMLDRELKKNSHDTQHALADRAELSLLYARKQYREYGVLVEYFMADGRVVVFEPTATDVIDHETWQKAAEGVERSKKIFFFGGIFWPLVFTLSFIFSCVPAVRRRDPGSEVDL